MTRSDNQNSDEQTHSFSGENERYSFSRRELEELISHTVQETMDRLKREDAGLSPEKKREPEKGALIASFNSVRQAVMGLVQCTYEGSALVDDFGHDALFRETVLPLFDFLYSRYWRVETTGLHSVPSQGRSLLVANHSGTLPYDALMISIAIQRYHPSHRTVRFLYLDLFDSVPFINLVMTRLGLVPAHPDNATDLLNREELTGVFPEGVKGIGKPYSQRYRLARFGRGGFVRIALKTQSPIIPVAVVGSEEIHPMIGQSPVLARLFGLPYFPITPTFPWLGLAGLIPFPSKWAIAFGEPIPVDHYSPADAENEKLVLSLSDLVRERIQAMILERLRLRRSSFFS